MRRPLVTHMHDRSLRQCRYQDVGLRLLCVPPCVRYSTLTLLVVGKGVRAPFLVAPGVRSDRNPDARGRTFQMESPEGSDCSSMHIIGIPPYAASLSSSIRVEQWT